MTGEGIMNRNELVHKLLNVEDGNLLHDLVQEVLQALLEAERDEHVGAGRYEQTAERRDVRSGYKPRSVSSLVGRLELRKPQTRDGMSSGLLERYTRIDQSVLTMAAEMYAQGVSTRRVEALLSETIGIEVSASTVSRANQRLDEAIRVLRERELASMPILIVDARFDKVRRDGAVRNVALLAVIGIDEEGRRRLLDFQAVEGETKAAWRDVFQGLQQRGLRDVRYVISDNHEGLRDAVSELFVGAVWQRCQTHITRNIVDRTPHAGKNEMGQRIREVFTAPDERTARRRLRELTEWADEKKADFGSYLEETMEEGLAVMSLPSEVRRKLRTTNLIERINQELKRRTKVVRIFPSMASYERCVGTILVHIDERWQESGYRYVDAAGVIEALGTVRV